MEEKSHWRGLARPLILQAHKEADEAGMDDKARRKHVEAAYPFGPRELHPFKMWKKEVAFIERGRKLEAKWREATGQAVSV